ncbi:MAG TPA: hypothetical protein VH597_03150 [Verrucomicrobiae bacterium]|jgi:hypothetical protein|nr:hypothetical protein [Verrucomicrobiae bacterium]
MSYNYDKLTSQYLAWVERQTGGRANYLPKEADDIPKALVTAASEGDCRGMAQNLSYLGNWYARHGVVEISRGNAGGWTELSLAALDMFWRIRIKCRSYDRTENKIKASNFAPSILDAGKCGILCFSLNGWAEAGWMGRRLEQSREDESLTPWTWKHAVPRLVIALHRYLEGNKNLSDLELGAYEDIFGHWEDSDGLKKALLQAADYHAANLKDKGNDIAEFSGAPIDIMPAELVSIQRVREKLGLETPAIDHPLMKTPLANPPRDLKFTPDDLLTKVIDKVGTIIPDL